MYSHRFLAGLPVPATLNAMPLPMPASPVHGGFPSPAADFAVTRIDLAKELVQPSSDTTVLVAAAERGMRKIYQPGYRLAKAGVMLLDLSPQTRDQPSLLPEEATPTGRDHSALMEAMDRINQRWGKGAVAVGSAVQEGAWGMRQERRSPHYTTRLEDVPPIDI